jgi:hypothetical protein
MSTSPDLQARINAFIQLGKRISSISEEEKQTLFRKAENQNAWFISSAVDIALKGIQVLLEESNLKKWLSEYQIQDPVNPKNVGLLMAGNIPAVGFHDLLCVLLSGHMASVKLSSSDSILIKWLIEELLAIEPGFGSFISIEEMLKAKDAYIATGSDNSARYFNYYFGKYPNIIRSNRTSVAILTGEETDDELEKLGVDIFQYFGLGCRNVSKIFVKSEDSLIQLLRVLERNDWISSHHKYLNNYDYNKSIYLVNGEPHLDNGFLILKESQELVSPIAVLFYEKYRDKEDLEAKLSLVKEKIQCIVADGRSPLEGRIPFGQAQFPCPWDYADDVDTLKFLISLT